MLIGRDMSHWNSDCDVNAGEFTIVKLTEGQNYTDPKAKQLLASSTAEQLLGVYHYLRADVKGNHPFKEAENFVNRILETGMLYKAVLVVDYEGKSLGHEDYLLQFMQGVEIMTGVKPLVYTSASETRKLKKICDAGYKLWVAHYNVGSPRIYNWKYPSIWQFTSTPFDVNIFYGFKEDWLKLCERS